MIELIHRNYEKYFKLINLILPFFELMFHNIRKFK